MPPHSGGSDYGSDFSPSDEDALVELLSNATGGTDYRQSVKIENTEEHEGLRKAYIFYAVGGKGRGHAQHAELSTAPTNEQEYNVAVEIDGYQRDEPTSTLLSRSNG